MSDELKEALLKERARWALENQFYTYYGLKAFIKDGFTLVAQDLTGMAEIEFPITSVGVLMLTYDLQERVAMLIINEEDNRWDIPSGRVEPSDSNPIMTGTRELHEETGFTVDQRSMLPLTWEKHPTKQTVGLQFLSVNLHPAELIGRSPEYVDDEGRTYFPPQPGLSEQNKIVLEPLSILLDKDHPDRSLLRNSHHAWAYKLTRRAVIEKLRQLSETEG